MASLAHRIFPVAAPAGGGGTALAETLVTEVLDSAAPPE